MLQFKKFKKIMNIFSATNTKSILEFKPIDGWLTAEAYLYRYTNTENQKIYVGIHKHGEKAYFHSSTDEELKMATQGSKPILILEILQYGEYKQMQDAENAILTEVDATNNPQYYNKTNGSPSFKRSKTTNIQQAADIVAGFESGEYNLPPRVNEKGEPIEPCGKMDIKELLARYEIHQVRDVQFDFSKVRDIKELIDAKGGNTDECDPINVLFCQTYPNGAIINGSHTARAIELSDLAQEAPVAIHTDMSVNGETLDMISNMRNRRPEKIKSDSTLEDLAALLVKNKIASVKFDFEGADALRIMELNNILLASDKKKIKELAVEKWNKYSEGSRPVVRVDYRHPDNKKKAKKQAKNKEVTGRVIAFGPLAAGAESKIHEKIVELIEMYPEIPEVVICYWCRTEKIEKKWNASVQPKLIQQWDSITQLMSPVEIDGIKYPRKVRFEPLTKEAKNPNYDPNVVI